MTGKKLTRKQQFFVKEYIDNNGNGTKAALAVYDTNDYNTAHAIAAENLQKPTIHDAIRRELEQKGVTLNEVLENVKDNMKAGKGVKATATDSLRAADMLFKVMGAYPDHRRTEVHITNEQRYASMNKEELMQEWERHRMLVKTIMEG